MSILIKGVDMPKDGCHHMICIYADGTVSTGGREYTAIPVPTPHGRLIDGDVLLAFFNDAAMNTGMIGEAVLGGVCETIAVMPTIIEAEEGETKIE